MFVGRDGPLRPVRGLRPPPPPPRSVPWPFVRGRRIVPPNKYFGNADARARTWDGVRWQGWSRATRPCALPPPFGWIRGPSCAGIGLCPPPTNISVTRPRARGLGRRWTPRLISLSRTMVSVPDHAFARFRVRARRCPLAVSVSCYLPVGSVPPLAPSVGSAALRVRTSDCPPPPPPPTHPNQMFRVFLGGFGPVLPVGGLSPPSPLRSVPWPFVRGLRDAFPRKYCGNAAALPRTWTP